RHMIRRLVAPPALPALIRPRPAHRPEHVPSENPGADAGEAELGHLVVDAGLAVGLSVHLPPDAGVKEPFHPLGPADAERMLEILTRSGAVSVDRDREALHPNLRQLPSPRESRIRNTKVSGTRSIQSGCVAGLPRAVDHEGVDHESPVADRQVDPRGAAGGTA